MSDIRTLIQLKDYLSSRAIDEAACSLPTQDELEVIFPMRIPYFYANLIDWTDINDPLRLMVLPSPKEANIKEYEISDPIGDTSHEPVAGLIHRYPDRCLLLLTSHCGVHCRFCFRREVVGKVRPFDLEKIYEYLSAHKEISEIIFSGGDPATFPAEFLARILEPIKKLPHIKIVRIHTRSLVVDPMSFSNEWLKTLKDGQGDRVVVLHINHPREITSELKSVVAAMKSAGVRVLSQTVLLKGVNDSQDTLLELFKLLSQAGIQAYYLHHLDKAQGTDHFRISIESGKRLFNQLRGKISGYMLPEYVVDLPGGFGKVPVNSLLHLDGRKYLVTNFRDEEIIYYDPMGDENE